MKLLQRRALVGLFAGVSALAFPAVAAATIHPSLSLTPNGPAGATNQTLTYHLSFGTQTPASDSPASITTHFPAGLLADSTLLDAQNGNAPCLTNSATGAHATDVSCQIGSGTATLSPGGTLPAAEYLVAPPNAADAAGVQLALEESPGTFTPVGPPADVTIRSADAGLDVKFSNIPGPTNGPAPQLQDLNLQLTHLRLPSSCAPEQMTVNTVSENGDSESANAPYQSTGCPSQPYAPKVAAQVKDLGGNNAEVISTITQGATEAASKSIELDLPSSLAPNTLADAGCLTGTPCVIGTASALTPLAPSIALAHGTVTLGGTLAAPTITIAFPAPYALKFVGAVNLSNNSVTVSGIPDVPITSLNLDIKDGPHGAAFTTTCQPSSIGAKFTGQGGQTANVSAPISYSGCSTTPPPVVGKPTATGSLSGLAARKPVLKLHLKHGSNAPNLKSVKIGLGGGLSFSSKGLIKHCHGKGKHRKCTVTAKGLSASGMKSFKLAGGKLLITFGPAGQETITVRGPLLAETSALQKKVKKHKVKHLSVTVRLTDARGHVTTITLSLKA